MASWMSFLVSHYANLFPLDEIYDFSLSPSQAFEHLEVARFHFKHYFLLSLPGQLLRAGRDK